MKTMTVRDIRQRWPEAEKALALEKEIVITRDGVPVAKLLAMPPAKPVRKRFDPAEHRRWQESVFGKGVVHNVVDKISEEDRAERE